MQYSINLSLFPESEFPEIHKCSSVLLPDNDYDLRMPKLPISKEYIELIAKRLNIAYDQLQDQCLIIDPTEHLYEHIEEGLGGDISSFITGLCHSAGYTEQINF